MQLLILGKGYANHHASRSHFVINSIQINALDALIMGYNGLSVLRQQTMPGDIIGGQITNGGQAPNIIHKYSEPTRRHDWKYSQKKSMLAWCRRSNRC